MLSAAEGLTVTASTRRAFLLAATLAAVVLAACSRRHEAAGAPRPPDVLILLADDLGWADVGWHARDAIETPQLDRLAHSGLMLERFYTAPLCTPARAGLLTGRSPLRLGLLRNLTAQDEAGLPLDEELLPQIFRRAGYRPLLLYVAFNAPHPPLEKPPGAMVAESDTTRAGRATYRLVVAELDRAIGEILGVIERSERVRDTVVFFGSDNGADLRYG